MSLGFGGGNPGVICRAMSLTIMIPNAAGTRATRPTARRLRTAPSGRCDEYCPIPADCGCAPPSRMDHGYHNRLAAADRGCCAACFASAPGSAGRNRPDGIALCPPAGGTGHYPGWSSSWARPPTVRVFRSSRQQCHPGAVPGEALCGRPADPRGGPGDHHHLPIHSVHASLP